MHSSNQVCSPTSDLYWSWPHWESYMHLWNPFSDEVSGFLFPLSSGHQLTTEATGVLFNFPQMILVNLLTQATTLNIFFQLVNLICNIDTISFSILLIFNAAVFFTSGSSLMSLTSLSFYWNHLDTSYHKNYRSCI